MKRKLKEEDIKEIIELYENNNSATKIAKKYETSTATICKYLKDRGINVINRQNLGKLSFFERLCVLGNYLIGNFSLSRISKSINVNLTTVSKFIHSQNIQVVNLQNEDKFDSSVFDNIDTEEKAYWLGFIFADGYVSSRDNCFELTIKESDKDHLIKFNSFMKHKKLNIREKRIKLNNKLFLAYSWSVVNKHLKKTLVNYGCVERKSTILKFPIGKIQKDLIRHFIRGYFDGDGCITYSKENNLVYPLVSLLGTPDFLEEVSKILYKNNIISNIISDKRMKSTKILTIRRCSVFDVLAYLYDNSTIYLNRKYNRYNFFKNCRSVKELTDFLASEIGEG